MPSYPGTTTEAQQQASEIAQRFSNYQCVEFGHAIVRAVGPHVDAAVRKLRVAPGKGGQIILPSKAALVSTSGHHVGVRIGDMVFDNNHPNGVPVVAWANLYVDAEGGALIEYEQPIALFYGKILRSKAYSNFASSRFQEDILEIE